MADSVSIYDLRGLEQFRRARQLDPRQLRRLRNDLLKRFLPDDVALAEFPAPDALTIHFLEVASQAHSQLDGATKMLLRTSAGLLVEAVILRTATGRTTLCVSTQVGCAAACSFCATGQMGIARNLSRDEILDQVLLAGQLVAREQRVIRNIVLMGMGEPFHNEAQLYAALEGLTAAELFHHSPTKILVSTVGIPAAMLRCNDRFPTVRLALSLHSVRQEIREQLMPIAKKYPLTELRATLQKMNQRSPQPIMLEYLLLAGVNDSLDDAGEVADWSRGLNVHLNLIPFNPVDGIGGYQSSRREQREAFARALKQAGFKTTIRYSLGKDIAAACGQLARQENRAS